MKKYEEIKTQIYFLLVETTGVSFLLRKFDERSKNLTEYAFFPRSYYIYSLQKYPRYSQGALQGLVRKVT